MSQQIIASSKAVDIFDFHGGIHPAENKHQSTTQPIVQLPIKANNEYVVPLNQHIGAPAKLIVEVGQQVLTGQVLAQANGFVSAGAHAPTSGVIIAIEERAVPHSSELPALCVVIKADGQDQWIECRENSDYLAQDAQQLLASIQNSGIAGMGGAGFPSSVKLNVGQRSIDTLIINAAECEPYITSDDMLMRERADQVIKGIEILLTLTSAKQCLIGIEDNKPEAISALKNALENAEHLLQTKIALAVVPTKYPSGGEKQLIKLLTNKEVPVGKIPADIGVVCQNVATTVAIYQALAFSRPLISRITTVTGFAIKQPQNIEVRIGTPISQLLDFAGFKPSTKSGNKRQRLIMGGPMMGFTLPSSELPIIKTSNCVLAPSSKEVPHNDFANPCIRCGLCTEACPAELLPQQLYWFAKGNELDKAEQHNIFDCIECGACSYVCPSQIPLVQYYRFAKGSIRDDRAAKEKAERARMRHEAREARIEAEKLEKEAKRKARAEQAAKTQAAKKAAEAAGTAPAGKPAPTAAGKAAPAAMSDLEKLQKQLKAAQTAVEKSKEKLAVAEQEGSDKVALFQSAIEKSQAKIKTLALEIASAKKAAANNPAAASDKGDPNSPERLEKKWQVAQSRLETAEKRLAEANEQGLDTAQALALGLEKQQARVKDAKAAFDAVTVLAKVPATATETETTAATETTAGDNNSESAANAEREKLAAKIRAQQARLDKAQQNLDLAKEQNLSSVDALTRGVSKQQDKLAALQQELAQQESKGL